GGAEEFFKRDKTHAGHAGLFGGQERAIDRDLDIVGGQQFGGFAGDHAKGDQANGGAKGAGDGAGVIAPADAASGEIGAPPKLFEREDGDGRGVFGDRHGIGVGGAGDGDAAFPKGVAHAVAHRAGGVEYRS